VYDRKCRHIRRIFAVRGLDADAEEIASGLYPQNEYRPWRVLREQPHRVLGRETRFFKPDTRVTSDGAPREARSGNGIRPRVRGLPPFLRAPRGAVRRQDPRLNGFDTAFVTSSAPVGAPRFRLRESFGETSPEPAEDHMSGRRRARPPARTIK
jgi:hypothetical protein